jgi:hypothetical protein
MWLNTAFSWYVDRCRKDGPGDEDTGDDAEDADELDVEVLCVSDSGAEGGESSDRPGVEWERPRRGGSDGDADDIDDDDDDDEWIEEDDGVANSGLDGETRISEMVSTAWAS